MTGRQTILTSNRSPFRKDGKNIRIIEKETSLTSNPSSSPNREGKHALHGETSLMSNLSPSCKEGKITRVTGRQTSLTSNRSPFRKDGKNTRISGRETSLTSNPSSSLAAKELAELLQGVSENSNLVQNGKRLTFNVKI